MTDREMLEKLFAFFVGRDFVTAAPEAIKDMVKRYEQPPLTMYRRVAMQMTQQQYDELVPLLMEIQQHLFPVAYSKPEEAIHEPV